MLEDEKHRQAEEAKEKARLLEEEIKKLEHIKY